MKIRETLINALGNPNFDSNQVFQALKDAPQNGSISAMLNILPELEAWAKKHYGDTPKILKR